MNKVLDVFQIDIHGSPAIHNHKPVPCSHAGCCRNRELTAQACIAGTDSCIRIRSGPVDGENPVCGRVSVLQVAWFFD